MDGVTIASQVVVGELKTSLSIAARWTIQTKGWMFACEVRASACMTDLVLRVGYEPHKRPVPKASSMQTDSRSIVVFALLL